MLPQAFVLRHRPVREARVEIAKGWVKRRFIVTTIVVHPTPYDGIEHPGQIVDPSVDATTELPVTYLPSDRLGRCVTDTGTEVDKELTPAILRPPGLKAVAQKVELRVRVIFSSIIILAVHDVCLFGMKLQPALSKTLRQTLLQFACLPLAAAMAENIVGKRSNGTSGWYFAIHRSNV